MNARRSDLLLATLERVLEIDAVDLRTALGRAADVVAGALRADKVDVFVYDPGSDSLVALGASSTPMGALESAAGLDRLPRSTAGRVARVHDTREPFVCGDIRKDPEGLRALAEVVGVRSTIMVHLDFGGHGSGVLNVDSGEVDRFGPADLELARAVARWIGLVGHRAKLTERIAEAARNEGRRGAAEELITVVAHDVRNFLSPALGRVQLLRRRAEHDGRTGDARDAAAAERSLSRVTRLVGDLLDVARVDQGLLELALSAVELVELVRDVAASHEVPGKQVVIRAPDEIVLTADPARLRQVFDNLLANALKHAAEATPVVVEITQTRDARQELADVLVANQGPPIPPDVAPRIFARFVRGEAGTTGLGLGLFLAREIVTAHGGTIALEPVTDGARFRVRLPIH